ncbi:uncharacterized protein N0V89_000202 [Didymosphaeria variabile]|uniref:DUF7730 domain-containing protein n=1 Tax=Didymosphaeria variabile TaxID=1932322 RepID=A0A9W8XTU1_9PLEO|nr:uncharacterized protein N0V89_000202 [Didymosphaeria variabile]KAJ4359647.1 hypothetical protein N0V89_000202 [Didymosphaeria variabile]
MTLQMSPSCGWWHVNDRQDNYSKRVVIRGRFDFPDNDPSRWAYLPDTNFEHKTMGVPTWKKSHLLSLPKELRLEIWKWTLTDPSVPDLVVNIGRDKKEAYGYSAAGAVIPRVTTWLQPGRNSPIGLSLLRTNRFIYEEALPCLYQSVKFAPADHQGIFPLFLDSLSQFPRSLIRRIKLHVPRQIYDVDLFGDPAVPLFHWAITCAQIAKLDGQLKDLEIEGLWTETGSLNEKIKRSILFPLCKIKARKIFGPNNDAGMEEVLKHAQVNLEHKAALRRVEAAAKAAADVAAEKREESGKKDDEGKKEVDDPAEQRQPQDPTTALHSYCEPGASDSTILRNLSTVAGIDAFEKELDDHTSPEIAGRSSADDIRTLTEDWDLVSYRSGASTPRDRPPSYMSRWSTDSWTDVASTIAETHDLDKDEEMEK